MIAWSPLAHFQQFLSPQGMSLMKAGLCQKVEKESTGKVKFLSMETKDLAIVPMSFW